MFWCEKVCFGIKVEMLNELNCWLFYINNLFEVYLKKENCGWVW